LDRTFKKLQKDIDNIEFGDIRRFYKYSFFIEKNVIFMILSTLANKGQKFIILFEVKEKYSLKLENKYQRKLKIEEKRLKISIVLKNIIKH
jgi:hypothetical protein